MRAFSRERYNWAAQWEDRAKEILFDTIVNRLSIDKGTEDEDLKECVDYVVCGIPNGISVRVRKIKYLHKFKDITFRFYKFGGSELEKNNAEWMLYMWVDEATGDDAWIIFRLGDMINDGAMELDGMRCVPGGNMLCSLPLKNVPPKYIVAQKGLDKYLSGEYI